MKEKLEALFFAIVVAVGMYIMISTAANNTAIDNAKLLQWHYENAVRP